MLNNKLEILKLTMTYCSATKLYWTDTIAELMNHHQALDYAKSLDVRLPTIDELKIAHKNGLKFDDGYFWSSSVHPDDLNDIFVIDGDDGIIVFDRQDGWNMLRCVVGLEGALLR